MFVTYCYRYYFALSLLLLVPFFPGKLIFADHVVFTAFRSISCIQIFCCCVSSWAAFLAAFFYGNSYMSIGIFV